MPASHLRMQSLRLLCVVLERKEIKEYKEGEMKGEGGKEEGRGEERGGRREGNDGGIL